MRRRRGWSLVQLIGGFVVGGLVLSACVPLALSALHRAEARVARARMTALAREIGSRFREDVRGAASARVGAGGRELRLARGGSPAGEVLYRLTPAGLSRASGGERSLYSSPLRAARFGKSGERVTARLELRGTVRGRELRYDLDLSAVPRRAGIGY